MNTKNRYGSAQITLQGDREILIVRQFDAPAALIFKAVTTPDLVKRWWGFPTSQWLVCDIDLQIGGTWRYVVQEQDMQIGFHGEYREIVAPNRLVNTEAYEGIPNPDAAASLITTTFEEAGGITTMTTHILHVEPSHRDAHIASGMEHGMQLSNNRLEDLLGTMT